MEEDISVDDWGPEKVLSVYDPDTGMKGVLVIDNTAACPDGTSSDIASKSEFFASLFESNEELKRILQSVRPAMPSLVVSCLFL